MKKHLLPGLLLACTLSLPAFAADPHTLTMTGHGEIKAVPDVATITAGVNTNAPTAAAALSANSARMNQVFAALKKLGVPDRDIRTAGFSVSPQYTNGDNNTTRRLTGYQVDNEVNVRLDDVTRTGAVLDTLVGAGANQMNGIGFDIANPAPVLEKARIQAVADARARAQTYAQAVGVTLGPIISITEGNSEAPPRPMFRVMAMAAPTPVAPGEQSVTADVTVVWEIH
ncbi:MAG TPA: SIMPL domain-containing protein [Rhizomicrobium sp.]|nr:SIMPL domain-containing protein [Rhizomicrobium sp.]